MRRSDRIEEAAGLWLVRRSEGLSPEQHLALEAWLDEADEHRMAFWRLEHAWEKAERLTALRAPGTLQAALTPVRPRVMANRRWFQGAAVAATLAIALLGGAASTLWPRPAAYHTERGERRLVSLSDGSRVELNTSTRLRAALSTKEREAWLDQGEAYFDVAHDATRPFVVHLGERQVRVLGTRFTLRREGDEVRVVVAEGRVEVADAHSRPKARPVVLHPGGVVTAERGAMLQTQTSMDQVENELAWRRGMVMFDQMSLGEAAQEFNRYNKIQLEIPDAQTAGIRIGGSFEADNSEAFVRLLHSAYGLKVERRGDRRRISE